MITSFLFIARLALTWMACYLVLAVAWASLFDESAEGGFYVLGALFLLVYVVSGAFSHVRRVRLIAGDIDSGKLANRQRRQIEIPFEAGEAFDLLDAAVRELPGAENVESARDSLQIRAKIGKKRRRNQILATVTPGDGIGSVTLICEPESAAWMDWFRVDSGTNFENAEAIGRALSRRVAERRRMERAEVAQTATEKELTVARLHLLHAQVEPHFLYNTLASAQYLTRSDPARADEMLGHLILYLRHSLPRTEPTLSTLGEELERARAYLEILKIRMGPRLNLQIDVPDVLHATPLPSMMLQTLVENAIKHGLEPKPGGGTVWLLARPKDRAVAITVADDGLGFDSQNAGTGIGLRNVRERLRLTYGERADLAIVSNFPSGVAATLTVPAQPEPARTTEDTRRD